MNCTRNIQFDIILDFGSSKKINVFKIKSVNIQGRVPIKQRRLNMKDESAFKMKHPDREPLKSRC